VPESVYKLIKGEHYNSPSWSKHFQTAGYLIKLTRDIGVGALSSHELETLHEAAERYAAKGDFEIAEETHKFEEWKRNWHGQGSHPIPVEDILKAVGREQDIGEIAKELAANAVFDKVFGG
jgi:hypothetical protein